MKNSDINTTIINGHTLEFIENGHIYVCDGEIVPSITQMLKLKFGGKYNGVSKSVLQKASEKGTMVHEAIEKYCKYGYESDLPEVRNFKFLQRAYKFDVIENEVPVILSFDGKPVSAGRLDLVIEKIGEDGVLYGERGIADIKRTSTLDKEYLAYQLNLYRIAYQQCYGMKIDFLKGIHLREEKRKYVDIPINEEMAIELVKEYLENNKSDGEDNL